MMSVCWFLFLSKSKVVLSLFYTEQLEWGGYWGSLVWHWLINYIKVSQHINTKIKGHTVPKQVSPLDDDITESTRKKKCYGSTVWGLHCLRTALCESIRYQAKSEQNVRQDLIPSVHHGEAALCTPVWHWASTTSVIQRGCYILVGWSLSDVSNSSQMNQLQQYRYCEIVGAIRVEFI